MNNIVPRISLKAALMTTMFVASVAGAVGLPVAALDFSKWASKTLKDDGITDARIVETKYPFSFTYCRKDSLLSGHQELLDILATRKI